MRCVILSHFVAFLAAVYEVRAMRPSDFLSNGMGIEFYIFLVIAPVLAADAYIARDSLAALSSSGSAMSP
jgi:hypothetical protein